MTLSEKIKLIKYHRLTPEERYAHYVFSNLKPYVLKNNINKYKYNRHYINSIFYKYDGNLMFEYNPDKDYFRCHNDFWRKLGNLREYIQIQDIVVKLAKEYLGLELTDTSPFYDRMTVLTTFDLVKKK